MAIMADVFNQYRGFIMAENREKFFTGLSLATIMVVAAHLFATVFVPVLLRLWVIVTSMLNCILFRNLIILMLMLPIHSNTELLATIAIIVMMLPMLVIIVELVTSQLANLAVCAELFLFQFPQKFFHRSGFIYVCHRYKDLNDDERASLWVCQTIRSAFRAIALEKGRSVMPTILHPVCTILKMAIHIDNELAKHSADPGGDWHGNVAKVAGAIVVVDWGFLVWDGVLGPSPQWCNGVLHYFLGFFIIAVTLVILAVLGKVAPSIGGGDEDLHRHIHWMHCVASFSVPGAQPIVILASFAVILNFFLKYSKP